MPRITPSAQAKNLLFGNVAARIPVGIAARLRRAKARTFAAMERWPHGRIARELEDSRRAIEEATGQKLRLFRAPSGAYNDLVISTARALGWEAVQWSNELLHRV